MGGACNAHGGYKKCAQRFGWSLKARDHLRNLAVGLRIILKWILGK
jgi:hypothetical protein